MSRLFLTLLLFVLTASPAWAQPHAKPKPPTLSQEYHHAFEAIATNHPQEAEQVAQHGPDPILNKVLRGYAMALPNNDYTFDQLDAFIRDNPGWPGLKGIQMIAEQKIPPNATSAQIIDWFATRAPTTLPGFYRYADALNQTGQTQQAEGAVRERWINAEFTGDEQTTFYNRYNALLDSSVMWSRMDHLLWKGDIAAAERMMPFVDATHKSIAEARLSFMTQQSSDPEMWVSRVPSDAQNEPGLLYQRLHWRVKNNRDDEADEILMHAPNELGNAEAWWDLRQVMVRRAIAQRDYALAYKLTAGHGQRGSKTLVQAEFLCGWLALRFLNQADVAREHFQILYDNATTPVTRARGAYWLARSYESLGDKNSAEQAYEDAAAFSTTYYGQLAMTRIYDAPVLTAKADPPLPEAARRAFMGHDLIKAALRLDDIGETDRAQSFFHAAVESATERAEFIVLTEVAARMHRPDLSIQAVKAANQKDMQVETGGFPLLDEHVPTPPESAFTHALIRQESMFNPGATSGVGARGLMQLMPRTAKDVARKLDIRYSESRLNEPEYSLHLGTAFVQQQIDHFNGSYVLALAGYNAGPGRVREWIGQFGDPRSPDTDPIDWVESIPLTETRNYVQRIIENIQIYRAKLAGGHAPLMIINDLKR
jgi:soluble lytic murein transglycosylase